MVDGQRRLAPGAVDGSGLQVRPHHAHIAGAVKTRDGLVGPVDGLAELVSGEAAMEYRVATASSMA